MPDHDLGTAMVLREWDEAWAQSRHLETTRGQYLGFFFTALLAVIAFVAHELADDTLITDGALVTVAALALILHLLSAFVYLAIVRINKVLFYYLKIILAIRDQIGSDHSPPLDLSAHSRPPTAPRSGLKSRLKTTQGVAELVPLLGVAAIPLVVAADLVRAVTLSHIGAITIGLCGLALLATTATCVVCRWAISGEADRS